MHTSTPIFLLLLTGLASAFPLPADPSLPSRSQSTNSKKIPYPWPCHPLNSQFADLVFRDIGVWADEYNSDATTIQDPSDGRILDSPFSSGGGTKLGSSVSEADLHPMVPVVVDDSEMSDPEFGPWVSNTTNVNDVIPLFDESAPMPERVRLLFQGAFLPYDAEAAANDVHVDQNWEHERSRLRYEQNDEAETLDAWEDYFKCPGFRCYWGVNSDRNTGDRMAAKAEMIQNWKLFNDFVDSEVARDPTLLNRDRVMEERLLTYFAG
ncbi:hypothetical protein BJ508DRAFT_302326 [Ascobolus immersus RN42]|uniref:Uncharacterized protein n=1 Tax=Ascobolus immersus RN42 TaxID=1160509 RepID=A0A3N4IP42_ASCIM|nr:hypothetical protein BJ508DRAFT_302326 [Ascobolus immersus RN42]